MPAAARPIVPRRCSAAWHGAPGSWHGRRKACPPWGQKGFAAVGLQNGQASFIDAPVLYFFLILFFMLDGENL